MHMKTNPSEYDGGSSGDGYPIPFNSRTESLVYSVHPSISLVVGCMA